MGDRHSDEEILESELHLADRGDEWSEHVDLLRLGGWPGDDLAPGEAVRERCAQRRREIETFPAAAIFLPLRDRFRNLYHWVVEPACHWENLQPVLIDRQVAGSRSAIDKAHDVMRSAALFVADITESTPNVFYEIGFMFALNKPGVLLSLDPGEQPHYVKGREVCRLTTGLDGTPASRRKLRAELRRIRSAFRAGSF
jgi:hypothetical protein